jgi:hypothetical protein
MSSTTNHDHRRRGNRRSARRVTVSVPHLFHVGKNHWYLVRWGKGTAIFKERGGVVEEIGKKADRTFLTSFS